MESSWRTTNLPCSKDCSTGLHQSDLVEGSGGNSLKSMPDQLNLISTVLPLGDHKSLPLSETDSYE
jgi:hypothetical protein